MSWRLVHTESQAPLCVGGGRRTLGCQPQQRKQPLHPRAQELEGEASPGRSGEREECRDRGNSMCRGLDVGCPASLVSGGGRGLHLPVWSPTLLSAKEGLAGLHSGHGGVFSRCHSSLPPRPCPRRSAVCSQHEATGASPGSHLRVKAKATQRLHQPVLRRPSVFPQLSPSPPLHQPPRPPR